jgi:hypothetical protein
MISFFRKKRIGQILPTPLFVVSLRRVNRFYTGPCLRVRRSSDNTEQNIGFVNNELDTASLLSFVGAGDGFVTTWNDQFTLGLSANQVTATLQPIIVSAGNLITVNGKVSVRSRGVNQQTFLQTPISQLQPFPFTMIIRGKVDALATNAFNNFTNIVSVNNSPDTARYDFAASTASFQTRRRNNPTPNVVLVLDAFNTNPFTFVGHYRDTGVSAYKSGTQFTELPMTGTAVNVAQNFTLFGDVSNELAGLVHLQEVWFFNNNLFNVGEGIERNINRHYDSL